MANGDEAGSSCGLAHRLPYGCTRIRLCPAHSETLPGRYRLRLCTYAIQHEPLAIVRGLAIPGFLDFGPPAISSPPEEIATGVPRKLFEYDIFRFSTIDRKRQTTQKATCVRDQALRCDR